MREIKFRAWDGENKEMEYSLGEFNCLYNGELTDMDGGFIYLQFTGLKDKNGKEIYEGDIVRDVGGFFSGDINIIEWNSEDGSWNNVAGNNELLEVIGNIYENPELLKEPTNLEVKK